MGVVSVETGSLRKPKGGDMIEGIEAFFQQIANSIQNAIAEEWALAWVESTFFTEHVRFEAEYLPYAGAPSKSFSIDSDGRGAFCEIRERFKQAGKKLWCRTRFQIESDGRFDMFWGYDDCDENGFARFDEASELERLRKRINR
jgi:Protein of unknown function, DUF600